MPSTFVRTSWALGAPGDSRTLLRVVDGGALESSEKAVGEGWSNGWVGECAGYELAAAIPHEPPVEENNRLARRVPRSELEQALFVVGEGIPK